VVKMKERIIEAKRRTGKKTVRGKTYEYEYYSLTPYIYVPKDIVKKFGTKFLLQVDEENGIITIKPLAKK